MTYLLRVSSTGAFLAFALAVSSAQAEPPLAKSSAKLQESQPERYIGVTFEVDAACRNWGIVEDELRLSLQAEWGPAVPEGILVYISCSRAGVATVFVENAWDSQAATLDLARLEQGLRHRAIALSVAETVPLLINSGQVAGEDPKSPPRSVPEAKTPPAARRSPPPPAPEHDFGAASPRDLPRTKMRETYLNVGAVFRAFVHGGMLFGGSMELQGNRLHVGTELLSGTASDDRVLMSFNGYLGYHILRKAVGFVRPDLGLRASVGYAGIDSRGVMYLGGALYSGLSFQISRSCHVRFAGEGGAQGWGRDSPARNVIGAFAGTSLTVGITPQ